MNNDGEERSEKEETGSEKEEEETTEVTDEDDKKGVLQTCMGPLEHYVATEENTPHCPAILAAGKRRTGKSTSLDNLMCRVMTNIPFGIVMSDTAVSGFWQKRVPAKFVVQGWRPDVLKWLLARQERLLAKNGNDKYDPTIQAFVIFDDVISDQNAIRYTKELNTFFVEGRHKAITVLITTQYMKGIGPMIRGNMDIVIIQPIYALNEREVLWGLFGSTIPKKDFLQLMDEVVEAKELPGSTARDPKMKFRVLMVQDWRQTPDVTKKFQWWDPVHSDELPAYRLCHPKYWEDNPMQGGFLQMPRTKRKLVDVLNEVSSVSVGSTEFQMGDKIKL